MAILICLKQENGLELLTVRLVSSQYARETHIHTVYFNRVIIKTFHFYFFSVQPCKLTDESISQNVFLLEFTSVLPKLFPGKSMYLIF